MLRGIAGRAGVEFDLLLELVANNDFSRLGSEGEIAAQICDLLDDELLALHADLVVNPEDAEPEVWVEQVFRTSLAVLQARSGAFETGAEDVLAFLRARAGSVLRRVPQAARNAVVSSSLPLSVALRANEQLGVFKEIADALAADAGSFPQLVAAVRAIEEWARAHARPVTGGAMPDPAKLSGLREGWLAGTALQVLSAIDADAREISKDFYGYQLPWIIHAASQQLRSAGESDGANVLAKLALLVELGVPADRAARIFLAGVRSRVAATELAALGLAIGSSVSEISRNLRHPDVAEQLQPLVSPATAGWLELMVAEGFRQRKQPVPRFPGFTVKGAEGADLLHARMLGERIFLATVDGATRIHVRSTEELPFDRVANDPRVAFRRWDSVWRIEVRDPRIDERL